jgi:hypothetical protein
MECVHEMISVSHWGMFPAFSGRKLSDEEVARFKAVWEDQHNSRRWRMLLPIQTFCPS